jgi:hypothetical protein
MFTLILVLRFDVSTEAVRRRDGIFRCWIILVAFDEDDDAEYDKGAGDGAEGEHEAGKRSNDPNRGDAQKRTG